MKFLCMVALAGLVGACDHEAPGRLTGTNPGSYDAGLGTCPATCSTPAATSPSLGYTWTDLIGVWRICENATSVFEGAPADTIGVEFAPPHTGRTYDAGLAGSLYFLTQGQSGPLRGGGFEYQQTYEIEDDGGLVLHQYYNDRRWFSAASYSACPRQWQLESAANVARLVPF